ncbi:MAG: TatD family hydrolase [Sandaracinaceae bacterium]|nr:TatD family hydrolase [Sandaracinaceae bacterium]
MRLFDSHCHLDFPEFDADRGEVLQRARAAGVYELLVPGYEPEQWLRAGAIALAATGAGSPSGRPWASTPTRWLAERACGSVALPACSLRHWRKPPPCRGSWQ